MKLHILSDLHIEYAAFDAPSVERDVVVLAGDIGVGLDALTWVSTSFAETPIVYVPGNHELYGADFNLLQQFKRSAPTGINILERDSIVIDGVRFLGTALWTDFCLFGEAERFFSMQHAAKGMPDFDVIRLAGRKFTPQDSVDLHFQSKEWLAEKLSEPFDGRTVVVTHHAPSALSVAPRFKMDPMSPAFASRLEPLIEKHQPSLWIHGHTHDAFDYELFGTRVVCNPRGYPEEVGRSGFDPELTVGI